jgi:hypothetical protein
VLAAIDPTPSSAMSGARMASVSAAGQRRTAGSILSEVVGSTVVDMAQASGRSASAHIGRPAAMTAASVDLDTDFGRW